MVRILSVCAFHFPGIDIKHPAYLPKPNIPIGVIPAGSTDTVACCLNGTTDIKTCIIHIILGQHSGLDISAVYSADVATKCDEGASPAGTGRPRPQLLKLFASALSYGYLGDIAYDSEKYRWMGPKRYDYSGKMGPVLWRQNLERFMLMFPFFFCRL